MGSLLIQNGLMPFPYIKIKRNSPLRKPNPKNYINTINVPSKAASFNDSSHRRGNELVVEVEGQKKYGGREMAVLCGFGYWVQGFRCFPWLALNFHMANNLNFEPSTLQLVQNFGNLPIVAKPLYGVLSDALYIGGAHRVPYICIGVLLQVFSWGPLAIVPFVGEVLPTLMACVLLSNLGVGLTEVAQDALVAEYGQKHKMVGLQSYTFMAIAVAGILGNLAGSVLLSRTHPRTVLFIFTAFLLSQLFISISTKEESLGLSKPSSHLVEHDSIVGSVKKQFSNLLVALREERIYQPLLWVVASISMVPMLTGSIFCYQSQILNLDPSIIGMSKVLGQTLLLSLTLLYDRLWKNITIRKLITRVQILYSISLLLDLVLVKQINLKVGIPNQIFAVCFSGLAETIATFKTVPFFVLIGSLCPPGCEASVTAFLASVLTLSSIVSCFLGVGLAGMLGIASGNYSSLPIGITLQSLAALVPLFWISSLPLAVDAFEKERKKGGSQGGRRHRRVGRVVLNSVFPYRRERKSEPLT